MQGCACTCVRETHKQWDMERLSRIGTQVVEMQTWHRDAERWDRDVDRKTQGHRNMRLFGCLAC